jgi:hypothetical protein
MSTTQPPHLPDPIEPMLATLGELTAHAGLAVEFVPGQGDTRQSSAETRKCLWRTVPFAAEQPIAGCCAVTLA